MSTASVRVRALYATELRMLLRDRRTVMLSIVLPLVAILSGLPVIDKSGALVGIIRIDSNI